MWILRHSRAIGDLERRLDALERDFKALAMDWDVVYDKVRKSMNRMVKSKAIMDVKESESENGSATVLDGATAQGHLLSPAQLRIQQQILRRRAGG